MTGTEMKLGRVWTCIQKLFSSHHGYSDQQTAALTETAFYWRNNIRSQSVQ